MSVPANENVTELLRRARDGDSAAESLLVETVYPELRRMAGAYMRGERDGHTLRPTALVHELLIRLGGVGEIAASDSAHFFAVCGQIMRRILVDYARRRRSARRGGDVAHVPLDDFVADQPADLPLILAIDSLLTELEAIDPRQARVVELKFFGGLSEDEIAEVTGLTSRTVRRDWKSARAWLQKSMSSEAAQAAKA